jgi:hypothetical protein
MWAKHPGMFLSCNQDENLTDWQIGKVKILLRGGFQAPPLGYATPQSRTKSLSVLFWQACPPSRPSETCFLRKSGFWWAGRRTCPSRRGGFYFLPLFEWQGRGGVQFSTHRCITSHVKKRIIVQPLDVIIEFNKVKIWFSFAKTGKILTCRLLPL